MKTALRSLLLLSLALTGCKNPPAELIQEGNRDGGVNAACTGSGESRQCVRVSGNVDNPCDPSDRNACTNYYMACTGDQTPTCERRYCYDGDPSKCVDRCASNEDCEVGDNPGTHAACDGRACVTMAGGTEDQCGGTLGGCEGTHGECFKGQCLQFAGEGPDECGDDMHCYTDGTFICSNGACVPARERDQLPDTL